MTSAQKAPPNFELEFATLADRVRAAAKADAEKVVANDVRLLKKRIGVLERQAEEHRVRAREYREALARYQRELAEARQALRKVPLW